MALCIIQVDNKEKRRVPLGLRRRQLPPGSLVHVSVVERMQDKELKYAPRNVALKELTKTSHRSLSIQRRRSLDDEDVGTFHISREHKAM
jgi:hypothetical protein